MAKVYRLPVNPSPDPEAQQIIVEETKTVTESKTMSVSQLKEQHKALKRQIRAIKIQMNDVIDQLAEIDANPDIAIKVADIPSKETVPAE